MPGFTDELVQHVTVTRRRRFRLTPEGLEVFVGSLHARRTFTVPVAILVERPDEEMVAKPLWFVVGALFGIATLVTLAMLSFDTTKADRWAPLLWGALTAISSGLYWKSRKVWLVWGRGAKAVTMLRDVPSATAVQGFLTAARAAARSQVHDDEQAVIVTFRYGLPDLAPLRDVEEQLKIALADGDVGEYDGDEMAVDLSDGSLYLYGPDADRLFAAIRSILEAAPFMWGASVKLRYGPPTDGVREETVTLGA